MSGIETGSIFAAAMIESLLSVHALTNMHRASSNDEYRKTAADWLPALERQFSGLRAALADPALSTRTIQEAEQ